MNTRTMAFQDWVNVSENLPAGYDRDTLIETIDNSFNGHQMTDPLTLVLGNFLHALVLCVERRLLEDRLSAFRRQSISFDWADQEPKPWAQLSLDLQVRSYYGEAPV